MDALEPRLYFCRDGGTVEGPFSAQLVRQMVFQKELSIVTPVCQEGTELWIPFSELPTFKLPELSGGAKVAARGCGILIGIPIVVFVIIPLFFLIYWLITAAFVPNSKQAEIEAMEPERKELAAEGQSISDAMEEANRNHDFSNVEEINERNAEFLRRSAEYMRKRQEIEAGDEPPAEMQPQSGEMPVEPPINGAAQDGDSVPNQNAATVQEAQEEAHTAEQTGTKQQPVRNLAPEGIVFNLKPISITSEDGVAGILAGTELKVTKRNPDGTLHVHSGDLVADVQPSDVTNDLDVVTAIRSNENEKQAALRQWQAQQSAAAAEMEAEKNATPTPTPDDYLQDSTPQPRYSNPLDRGPYR